jgi:hypothetical protein
MKKTMTKQERNIMKLVFLSLLALGGIFSVIATADEGSTQSNGSVSTAVSTNHDTWTLHRSRFPRKKEGSAVSTSTGTSTSQ